MRHEFSAKTKAAAALRSHGHCETCGRKLLIGDWFYCEYDHEIPDALGGDNSLSNCMCVCKSCHSAKTKTDVKRIAKAKRNFRKAHGIRKPRTITRWRKFNGEIVIAGRER